MADDRRGFQEEFTELVGSVRRYVDRAQEAGYTKAALSVEAAETLEQLGSSSADTGIDTVAELASMAETVAQCTKCPLHKGRTKTVFGTGDPHAELMLVGEAPGRDEDLQGEPFVGRAGRLLDKILAAINLTRDEVYIGNILKCRPPQNRNPRPDEVMCCMPYLERQIELIRPKLICALGGVAAHNLLDTTQSVGKMRGILHNYRGVPLIVTYHPAALLRSPTYKKPTWQDMQRIRDFLKET